MIFAGIDVDIITHEKLLEACAGGDLSPFGLWTFGMCHAQKHESNGRLARAVVITALGGRRNVVLAKKLVDSGLWSVNEDGSWQIWNYAKKNQSAEEIREKKTKASERVRAWRERRNAPGNAPGNADVTRYVTRNEQVRTQPEPSPSPDNITRQQGIGTASPPPEPVTQVRPRRKPETPCPPSEASPEAVATWAEGWRVPADHPEFAGWLDHHRKSDARWRDWAAAWRTWLKNASRFGQPRTLFASRHVQSADNRAWKLPEEMP